LRGKLGKLAPGDAWLRNFGHGFCDSGCEICEKIMSWRQGDLFDDEPADLFDEDRPTPVFRADPDKVRRDLHKMLAEARAAQTMPWNAKDLLLYRTIFPQMTNWLPQEEAAQLRREFEAELVRLEAA
jgi:hypothetical protein